ncbi:PLP-dependent aminotransferase family protein [Nocardioides albidus]|uniref:PLP-dependent aminotransferase family protein n=1 Tax=Nocardioides albidus TaxID=1517589 RepID=A0A5C4VPK3_9ACTN|nr:PLP-dependent aminotransferase family protein [Nocardioides albidus]TNM37742.1 PLP-dependent aminotransferase family protein [Nocardioides albidus]
MTAIDATTPELIPSLLPSLLAARAGGFRPSPVRDFWEVSMEPDVISLAGGNPDLSVLPLAELGEVATRAIAERGLEVLQYGGGAGTPGAREAAARTMAAEGVVADPQHVQVTAGSQMALDLVVKLLCDPGDVILAEGPSYVGAIGLFVGMQVDVVHVPIDDDGLVPAALEDTIARVRAEGRRIKALYTIPNFHNPSGVTLAAERRPEVVRICRDAGITIIEDNPYGLLSFDGTSQPSLQAMDPDNVIYLGSFSKVVAPGLRVGWAVAPEPMRRPLQLASEATVICASVLSQAVVEEYVLRHDWLGVLGRARSLYAGRAAAVLGALAATAPAGVTWSVPRGGFFTWVTLPEGTDVHRVLDAAIDRRVVFVPGSAFHADGSGANQLRLAFSLEQEDVLVEGVTRLMAAVAEVAGLNG